MKVVFCVLAAVLAVHASPIEDEAQILIRSEKMLYPKTFQFPDAEGNMRTVDFEEPVDYQLLNSLTRNADNTRFHLYTRSNPDIEQTLYINDERSVVNSNFDPRKHTVLVAHGWLSKSNSEPNPTVREVYLAKHDCNVITIDWHALANSNYLTAALGVPAIGERAGEFVNWLHETFGLRYENVHLVGFSLGAHLVGNAGRTTGGRVARVTGLDPAGPMWNLNGNKLCDSDAVYVEAIHTDGGYTVGGLGIGSSVAQVDFFPNGGISQPGCWTNICNHARSWQFFGASVTYNHFLGSRCSNWLQMTLNTCRGAVLHMGNDDLNKTGTPGSYRVTTGRSYPY